MKPKNLKLMAWLLTATLVVGMAACGGGDDSPANEPTPVTPTNPETPTQPETPVPTVQACQGWPEAYDGVMLQGFWWDSYSDSRWTVLTQQADELSQYFQLIWVPNSGKTADFAHNGRQTMGYDPCYWLDHNSCFGTESELREMIKTFKAKGTGIIEDVVINHKNGLTSWVDFPDETQGTYTIKWDNTNYTAICINDECNSNGYKTGGAKDTGDNFDGYRDLDHTNLTVQQNVGTYLSYLLNELGYVGFRYDMVKGYGARYTAQYNATALPQFSVGECWDGSKQVVTNWINGTKKNGQIQSAAFDFPLKYVINTAFGSAQWAQLASPAVLATDPTYQRYAVTFVDNHDTYREQTRLADNVCAANAYILCMPGTPCLLLKHWQLYRGTLKRLIALRRAAGINSQSEIASTKATADGATIEVKGTKGSLLLTLGNAPTPDDRWTAAVEGYHFKVYATTGVDLSALRAVADQDAVVEGQEPQPTAIPEFCTVAAGEMCAFFEAPSSWGTTIKCWAWNDTANYTGGTWPGTDCTRLGTAANGKDVWKWSYSGTLTTRPTGIIFNDGQNQTADLPFQNGGYYTEEGLQGTVSAE